MTAISHEARRAQTSATDPQAALTSTGEAVRALADGPKGALIVASLAVGLLFIGWLAFYFLIFMARGAIG
jgi:hypothetical protein